MSLEVNGFKHDLYEVPSAVTATSVRIQFVGSNLKIYALMVLELGLEISRESRLGSDITAEGGSDGSDSPELAWRSRARLPDRCVA